MRDIIQDLKDEGALVLFHSYQHRCAHDWSGNNNNHGVPTNVDWTGRGAAFPTSTSLITVPDSTKTRLTTGALIWFNGLGFDRQPDAKLISKRDGSSVNYELGTTPTQLTIYDGVATRTLVTGITGKRMIGVNLPAAGGTCEGFIDAGSVGSFSGASTFTADSADLIFGNLYSGGYNFAAGGQSVLIVNRELTATEHSRLYGQLSAMTAPTKIVGHTDTPLTKTDWGANESGSAVTSGFIENTPFEALTGSFKVVTDTLDGEVIKSFECISTGTIQFPAWGDGSDSDWTGYEDTGAGYASATLSLTSLVHSMTTGDKLAIGNRAGNFSVRKE